METEMKTPLRLETSSEKGGEVVKAMEYIVSKQVATQQTLKSRGMPQRHFRIVWLDILSS